MGCAQSKVDNEEAVSRCKERRRLMKEAVAARNAFAAGHMGYAMALKNTGAALSDYGHGETEENFQDGIHAPIDSHSAPPPPPPPPMESLPLPPPPLPNFSPSPLKRATSMPEFAGRERPEKDLGSDAIAEEREEEEEEDAERGEVLHLRRARRPERRSNLEKGDARAEVAPPQTQETIPVPPMPESKGMAWDYFFMVESMPGPSLQGVEEEDEEEDDDEDEDGEEMHHSHRPSNATNNVGLAGMGKENDRVDIGGGEEIEPRTPEKAVEDRVEMVHIEHSNTAPADLRRAMKGVGTGRTVSLMKVLAEIDDHFLKASESAQDVSKMLEATRLHYHSNFADNRGHIDHSARVMQVITWNKSFRGLPTGDVGKDDPNADDTETHATVLDKLLAWEKKLYDEVKQGELMKLEYQRKVTLLNKQKKRGASNESLEKTKAAVSHLHTRYIVDMQSMDSTASEINSIRDDELYPCLVSLVAGMADMWESMYTHHNNQLKLVSDLKALDITHASKETTKHHHDQTVQLQKVINEWQCQFERLTTHKKQYVRALHSWLKLNLIPIESSLKEKILSPPRAPNPPIQALIQSWHDYLEKLPDEIARSAITSFSAVIETIKLHQEEEMRLKEKCEETRKEFLRKNQAFEDWYQKHLQRKGPPSIDDEATPNDPVVDRQAAVESLKKRLDDEVEAYQRHSVQVREKSLGTLKIRLPELFRAMSDYSYACSDAYGKLKSMMQARKK